jgi:hypothetical protein
MKDFLAAVKLIGRIAPAAERLDHHPDLALTGYRRLDVTLSTHSIGGLSAKDFELAARIERMPKALRRAGRRAAMAAALAAAAAFGAAPAVAADAAEDSALKALEEASRKTDADAAEVWQRLEREAALDEARVNAEYERVVASEDAAYERVRRKNPRLAERMLHRDSDREDSEALMRQDARVPRIEATPPPAPAAAGSPAPPEKKGWLSWLKKPVRSSGS